MGAYDFDPDLSDRIYLPAALELRAGPNGPDCPTIFGVAGVCNQPTTIREMVKGKLRTFTERFAPGAFRGVLAERQDTVALINHDDNLILGRVGSGTLRLAELANGDLSFEVDPGEQSYARDLRISLQRGDMGGCSIGFLVAPGGAEWSADRSSVLIRSVGTLRDVSVVTKPAYRGTSVGMRSYSAAGFDSESEPESEPGDVAPDPGAMSAPRMRIAAARLKGLDGRILHRPRSR